MNINKVLKDIFKQATDYSGSSKRKVTKGILGIVIIALLGAIGFELSGDFFYDVGDDGKKIYVEKDSAGNVTNVKCGKNKFNCLDFSLQNDAQAVLEECGGAGNDINDLDRDKDGVACEDLPVEATK